MIYRVARDDDKPELLRLSRLYLAESPHRDVLGTDPARLPAFIDTVLRIGIVFVCERTPTSLAGMIAGVNVEHPLTGKFHAEDLIWFVEPQHLTAWWARSWWSCCAGGLESRALVC